MHRVAGRVQFQPSTIPSTVLPTNAPQLSQNQRLVGEVGGGLLGDEAVQAACLQASQWKALAAHFDLSAAASELRGRLQRRCSERAVQLALDGDHNPFLRRGPLPPTRVGLHLLLQPSSLMSNRAVDALYDPHTPGPTEHRGIPLRLSPSTSR